MRQRQALDQVLSGIVSIEKQISNTVKQAAIPVTAQLYLDRVHWHTTNEDGCCEWGEYSIFAELKSHETRTNETGQINIASTPADLYSNRNHPFCNDLFCLNQCSLFYKGDGARWWCSWSE